MLETQTIIDRVQQRDYPPDWRVYRARSKWGQAIFWIIFCEVFFFAIFGSAFAALFFTFLSSSTNNLFITILSALVLVGALAAGAIGIVLCIWRKARAMASTFLIIFPDGVFLCQKGRPEKTYTFAFADIGQINLGKSSEIHHSGVYYGSSWTTTEYWLDLYTCNGHYIKWFIDDDLGALDSIGNEIIAAHLYYWHRL